MKRTLIVFLACIGGLTITGVATLVALHVGARYGERNPRAHELEYVLNWAGLGDSVKIIEVVHAYASKKNPVVGDQTKAYSVRVDRFPKAPASLNSESMRKVWLQGPLQDSLLLQALETAASAAGNDGRDWFPTPALLNSPRFYLSFPHVTAYHGQVEKVFLTAFDTETRLLYHTEVAW